MEGGGGKIRCYFLRFWRFFPTILKNYLGMFQRKLYIGGKKFKQKQSFHFLASFLSLLSDSWTRLLIRFYKHSLFDKKRKRFVYIVSTHATATLDIPFHEKKLALHSLSRIVCVLLPSFLKNYQYHFVTFTYYDE